MVHDWLYLNDIYLNSISFWPQGLSKWKSELHGKEKKELVMWRNKGCMEKHGKIIAHFHHRKQGHDMQERQVI